MHRCKRTQLEKNRNKSDIEVAKMHHTLLEQEEEKKPEAPEKEPSMEIPVVEEAPPKEPEVNHEVEAHKKTIEELKQ